MLWDKILENGAMEDITFLKDVHPEDREEIATNIKTMHLFRNPRL